MEVSARFLLQSAVKVEIKSLLAEVSALSITEKGKFDMEPKG